MTQSTLHMDCVMDGFKHVDPRKGLNLGEQFSLPDWLRKDTFSALASVRPCDVRGVEGVPVRYTIEAIASLLKEWTLFCDIPQDGLTQLATKVLVERPGYGGVVTHIGDESVTFRLLLEGSVSCHHHDQTHIEDGSLDEAIQNWQCWHACAHPARTRPGLWNLLMRNSAEQAAQLGKEHVDNNEKGVKKKKSKLQVLKRGPLLSRMTLMRMGNSQEKDAQRARGNQPLDYFLVGMAFGQPPFAGGTGCPVTLFSDSPETTFLTLTKAEIDKVLIWYHSRVQIAHLLQMSQLQPHDLDVLVNLTKKNRFLSTLERKVHMEVCRSLRYTRVAAGVPCFLKGDVGDSFYIILSGSMAIQDPDTDFGHDMDQHEIRGLGIIPSRGKLLKMLVTGDSFGELALMEPPDSEGGLGKRAASIIACTDCELMLVHREDFQLILNSSMISDMSQKILFLQSMPVLEKAPRHQLNALACNMEVRSLPTGTVLAVEGKPADHMFFIKSGFVKLHSSSTELARPQKQPANRKSASQSPAAEKQASNAKRECRVKGVWKKLSEYEVVAETDNSPVDISMLGPGEMCGEYAVLHAGMHTMTAVALTTVEVYSMSAEEFKVAMTKLQVMNEMKDLSEMKQRWHLGQTKETLDRRTDQRKQQLEQQPTYTANTWRGPELPRSQSVPVDAGLDRDKTNGYLRTPPSLAKKAETARSMRAFHGQSPLDSRSSGGFSPIFRLRSNPLEQGSSRRELLPLSRSEASIGQQTSGEAAGEISVDDEILALKGFNDVILKMNNRQSQGRRWGHWTPQVDPPASIAEIQKGVNYNLASLMTPVGTVDKLLRPAISGGYVTPIQYPKRLEMRTGLWKSKPVVSTVSPNDRKAQAKIAISERDEKTAEVKQNISRFFGR
ncbi:hypothetical protein CYMTET_22746 [Cymbomonas tetramitiformis]|uniref:Cyclic nucleotide-binding domain-containing protein n=1 Tax=Cymbomonas tetramitiformis TaxID=36881 RepID=A0AAE0FZB4_9CHLO|nr:hypothetical protein CYMTET_22746 [Cymbomonas tetramitiformis]